MTTQAPSLYTGPLPLDPICSRVLGSGLIGVNHLRQHRRVAAQPQEEVLLRVVPAQLKPAAAEAVRLHDVDGADQSADRLEDVRRVHRVQPQQTVRRSRATDRHRWARDFRGPIQGGTVPLDRAVVLAQTRRRHRRRHRCLSSHARSSSNAIVGAARRYPSFASLGSHHGTRAGFLFSGYARVLPYSSVLHHVLHSEYHSGVLASKPLRVS